LVHRLINNAVSTDVIWCKMILNVDYVCDMKLNGQELVMVSFMVAEYKGHPADLQETTHKESLSWDSPASNLTLYYIGSHKGSCVVITLE
jgi:hypothetical protein